MIRYTETTYLGDEKKYILDVIENKKSLSGDREYTKKCHKWLEEHLGSEKVLLTTSGTHALDMAAMLLDIKSGDEVIMPSFTFSSTANAFALRGATIKFIDVRRDTMNMDENLIEAAITDKTKAIVPVHYSGVACDMDKIMEIANRYNIAVVEDAAQGLMSSYKGRPLGSIGTLGCFSFHETKNYSCGEGGAIAINDTRYIERAEIIREKGTNRTQLLRGEIDKYTWVDIGSSYLPSELNAAFLYGQLINADEINKVRLRSWNLYHELLKPLHDSGKLELPFIPEYVEHNAHLFVIRLSTEAERDQMIAHLKENGIQGVIHYLPLHSAAAGRRCGEFIGEDNHTTRVANTLIRIPMYFKISNEDIEHIVSSIYEFFKI